MEDESPVSRWFEPETQAAHEVPQEFSRIWQGFMTARFTLATLLMVLQLALYVGGLQHSRWPVLISVLYLTGTLVNGLFGAPRMLGSTFNRNWLELVGLDMLVFASLQLLHGTNINYTPLFALPILLTAVLGSRLLAVGTAASVTVLLLGSTDWSYASGDTTASLVQAALSGIGYFAMALLGNQLATRLVAASQQARLGQAAVHTQRQVNALVIEALPDGVVIVDAEGRVRAANPAAVVMLGLRATDATQPELPNLHTLPTLAELQALTHHSLQSGTVRQADLEIAPIDGVPRRIRVRTRPTASQEIRGEKLCVLFLQDQRELDARVRNEKLASMGRMSSAVAHEIRNPLAAIAQANALLDEDLTDPHQRQLTRMVHDNALRLSRIVDDILNVSRVPALDSDQLRTSLGLNGTTQQICAEWSQQNQCGNRLLVQWVNPEIRVVFEVEHLRRVLVNLLDNALRFASQRPASLQITTFVGADGAAGLGIWSDGGPLPAEVERHLFEPFVSSASRSSGLGLYICQELCQRHGAHLNYQRSMRTVAGCATEGNAFILTFAASGD